jgi:hypothetical protein
MLLLKVVQEAVGNQVKELYTLGSVYSVLDEDFLIEPNVFSGIYWVGSKARIFVVKENSFESYPLNV